MRLSVVVFEDVTPWENLKRLALSVNIFVVILDSLSPLAHRK